jgi:hypothetical protein
LHQLCFILAFSPDHAKVSHNLVNVQDQLFALFYLTSFVDQKTHMSLLDVSAFLFVVLNGNFPHLLKKEKRNTVISFLLSFIRTKSAKSVEYYSPGGEYSHRYNFCSYVVVVYLAFHRFKKKIIGMNIKRWKFTVLLFE